MRSYDRNVLREILENQDYTEFYAKQNPNDCWLSLYQTYLKCLERVVPLIEVYNAKETETWIIP